MTDPANIINVAKRAGVSLGTVSNVLNRPERVAPATRERVLHEPMQLRAFDVAIHELRAR